MNLENGQGNLLYTGELCFEELSNYSNYAAAAGGDESGLAYLEAQNNPLIYDLEDEMMMQHQHFNFVNLLNMSSTDCSGLGSASGSGVLYEPVQLREPVTVRQGKNFVTERQRRQTFNDKFVHLRSLLPNPNKNDRASIVGDAIEYIKELTRTVKELSILVEKKKQRLSSAHCRSINDDKNESLRSSWLQRKCKDTDIDVRIVHDEVTVKLLQRKTMFNLLLYVSKAFDELKLDLNHVTGGHVGDYCTFLFNTKISDGSSLYATAIADRLIHVLNPQYTAFH